LTGCGTVSFSKKILLREVNYLFGYLVTHWTSEELWFDSQQSQEVFLFTAPERLWIPPGHLCSEHQGSLGSRAKSPFYEAHLSPTSMAGVKMGGTVTLLLHAPSCRAQKPLCLIRDGLYRALGFSANNILNCLLSNNPITRI